MKKYCTQWKFSQMNENIKDHMFYTEEEKVQIADGH